MPDNANVAHRDGEDKFDIITADLRELLTDLNTIQFCACIFALGERMVSYRTKAVDINILSELKAIYQTIHYKYDHAGYADLAEASLEGLTELFITQDIIQHSSDTDDHTPNDISIMISLYGTAWQLIYKSFKNNPSEMLSLWEAGNHYENRAIRAVLADIDYKELINTVWISAQATLIAIQNKEPYNLICSINKKHQTILEMVTLRDETKLIFANIDLANASLTEQLEYFKQKYKCIKENHFDSIVAHHIDMP
jgi:hypothetical protein